MRVWNLLLIIIFLTSLLFIAGCGEKPECESSTECATGNPCIVGRCVDGACKNNIQVNCCGNAMCEPDYGENKCLCPADCGKCEGKAKYNVSTYRGLQEKEANYAKHLCENNVCIVGVSASDVNILKLANEVNVRRGFKAEVLTTLNNPYDISKGTALVRVQLRDIDPDVTGGIKITSLQILSDSELMGEKIISKKLNKVGDMFTEELTLTSSQGHVEEEKRVDVKVDYEYVRDERDGPVTYRDDSKNRLSEKVIFVKGQ